ncbi:MAG: cobalamin B12-binding domain-containing protein, partial [Pseudomonadota bacterium]
AEYILSRMRDGRSIESVYTAIVLPALQHIRFRWIKNSISAADEHAAGDICRYIIFRIADSIFGERQYPFKALVACLQGEENMLGAEVLANFMEIKGWVVMFLGHDAPDEDIIHALTANSAQIAVLSVSSIARLPAAKSLIRQVRTAVPQVKIILEGRAIFLAREEFQPLADGIVSGFEEGHAAMLTLVTAHA